MCSAHAPEPAPLIRYNKCIDQRVVTLELDPNEPNNENRHVVNKQYAKYKCRTAKVIRVEDLNDPSIEFESASSYYNYNFEYIVGKIITEPNYDPDIDEVCSPGIHYFRSKNRARSYNEVGLVSGLFIKCDDDGGRLSISGTLPNKRVMQNIPDVDFYFRQDIPDIVFFFIYHEKEFNNNVLTIYYLSCSHSHLPQFKIYYLGGVHQKLEWYNLAGSIYVTEHFTDGKSMATEIKAGSRIIQKKVGEDLYG